MKGFTADCDAAVQHSQILTVNCSDSWSQLVKKFAAETMQGVVSSNTPPPLPPVQGVR